MRTVPLILLASSASLVLSAPVCTSTNFLSTKFGIPLYPAGVTVAAGDVAGFKYCNIQADNEVCCLQATYAGFQEKANDYIDALQELAGDRDQYILDRRGDVLAIRDSLNKIVESLANADTKVAAGAAVLIGSFSDFAEALTTGFDELKSDFLKYQKARATCMKKLIETHVSAWCLACSSALSDVAGVTVTNDAAGTVTYSTALKAEFATACYDYIEYSAGQSEIITLYVAKDVLSSLASVIEKAVNGDASGASEALKTVTTALEKAKIPTDAIEKPVTIPETCTKNSCAWLTDNAFVNGVLQDEAIIQGGSLITSLTALLGSDSSSNRRLEGAADNGRLLAAGDWVPATTGVTVAFEENPGNVDNDQNSAVRNGIVACAIAALALVF